MLRDWVACACVLREAVCACAPEPFPRLLSSPASGNSYPTATTQTHTRIHTRTHTHTHTHTRTHRHTHTQHTQPHRVSTVSPFCSLALNPAPPLSGGRRHWTTTGRRSCATYSRRRPAPRPRPPPPLLPASSNSRGKARRRSSKRGLVTRTRGWGRRRCRSWWPGCGARCWRARRRGRKARSGRELVRAERLRPVGSTLLWWGLAACMLRWLMAVGVSCGVVGWGSAAG